MKTPANINPTKAAIACGEVEKSQSKAFLSIIYKKERYAPVFFKYYA